MKALTIPTTKSPKGRPFSPLIINCCLSHKRNGIVIHIDELNCPRGSSFRGLNEPLGRSSREDDFVVEGSGAFHPLHSTQSIRHGRFMKRAIPNGKKKNSLLDSIKELNKSSAPSSKSRFLVEDDDFDNTNASKKNVIVLLRSM